MLCVDFISCKTKLLSRRICFFFTVLKLLQKAWVWDDIPYSQRGRTSKTGKTLVSASNFDFDRALHRSDKNNKLCYGVSVTCIPMLLLFWLNEADHPSSLLCQTCSSCPAIIHQVNSSLSSLFPSLIWECPQRFNAQRFTSYYMNVMLFDFFYNSFN